jgi:hypothetical protein
MICSTTPSACDISYGPGVADSYTVCPIRCWNSSQRSGRLSIAGQPEPVIDQGPLARHVALVHPTDLRHGHCGEQSMTSRKSEHVPSCVELG